MKPSRSKCVFWNRPTGVNFAYWKAKNEMLAKHRDNEKRDQWRHWAARSSEFIAGKGESNEYTSIT